MRSLIRGRQICADDWSYPAAASEVTGPRRVLPLAQFVTQFAGADESGPEAARGVWIAPTDSLDPLLPWLQQVELAAVEFTSVGDGRGYTHGRLLRERHGFRGELRAVGAAKRDQLYFLARCGFDTFDLASGEDLQAALLQLQRFSVAYQRTTGELLHPAGRAS